MVAPGGFFGPGFDALAGAASGTAGSQIGLSCDPITGDATSADHLSPVNPHLDANGANIGVSRRGSVVDVGAQCVKGHATLSVPLTPTHV